jgi:hypothetical protein
VLSTPQITLKSVLRVLKVNLTVIPQANAKLLKTAMTVMTVVTEVAVAAAAVVCFSRTLLP